MNHPQLRRAQARATALCLSAQAPPPVEPAVETDADDDDTAAPDDRRGVTVAAVLADAQASLDRHDAAVASELVVLRDVGAIACKAGCDHCCSLEVHGSFMEMANLAAFIERTFEPAAVEALRVRIAQRHDASSDMSAASRSTSSRACVLLVEGRCSAYAARPFACRGWSSASADPCREARERPDSPPSIPVVRSVRDASVAAAQGVRDSIRAAGLDDRRVELASALHVLLGDVEGATRGWLEGKLTQSRMVAALGPRKAQGDDGLWRVEE